MNGNANTVADIINTLIKDSNDKVINRAWKRGVVSSAQGQMCDVNIEGNPVPTQGIIALASYQPSVGDTVLVLSIGDTGTNLVILGALKASTSIQWRTISLKNGWENYGSGWETVGYYKDSAGIVHMRGFIKNGEYHDGNVILTLPEGFRPSSNKHMTVAQNGIAGYVHVMNSGDITTGANNGNGWLSLAGLSWVAEL